MGSYRIWVDFEAEGAASGSSRDRGPNSDRVTNRAPRAAINHTFTHRKSPQGLLGLDFSAQSSNQDLEAGLRARTRLRKEGFPTLTEAPSRGTGVLPPKGFATAHGSRTTAVARRAPTLIPDVAQSTTERGARILSTRRQRPMRPPVEGIAGSSTFQPRRARDAATSRWGFEERRVAWVRALRMGASRESHADQVSELNCRRELQHAFGMPDEPKRERSISRAAWNYFFASSPSSPAHAQASRLRRERAHTLFPARDQRAESRISRGPRLVNSTNHRSLLAVRARNEARCATWHTRVVGSWRRGLTRTNLPI